MANAAVVARNRPRPARLQNSIVSRRRAWQGLMIWVELVRSSPTKERAVGNATPLPGHVRRASLCARRRQEPLLLRPRLSSQAQPTASCRGMPRRSPT